MVYSQESLKYSFYELSEILKNIPIEYDRKLPQKFKDLVNENKIDNGFIYDKNKSLDKQKILHDTKILLSVIYRTYWCTAEQRKRLELEDNEILRAKYNPNNIFTKNDKEESNEQIKENIVEMVQYKENSFKKIINKIKNFFCRK